MGQPGSFALVPSVTLPATTDVSGLSLALLHNTLTQRLPGAGLPPGRAALCREEGRTADRPGDRAEPAQVLGHSRELKRALTGIAEDVGFGTGCWGKAPSQSDRVPQDTSPSCPAIAQVMALLFSWGLSWLGGDELWDVSSEHFVLQTPSVKVVLTFKFTFCEKSRVATPRQEKLQGSP